MKHSAILILATLSLAGPAFAQTATPAPTTPAPTAPAASPAPDMTKDGKPSAKSVRKECRTSVKSEGLKGDERRKAVSDCFIKQRPDLAAKETARLQCSTDAKTKGIAKGDAHKAFMKDCIKSKV